MGINAELKPVFPENIDVVAKYNRCIAASIIMCLNNDPIESFHDSAPRNMGTRLPALGIRHNPGLQSVALGSKSLRKSIREPQPLKNKLVSLKFPNRCPQF